MLSIVTLLLILIFGINRLVIAEFLGHARYLFLIFHIFGWFLLVGFILKKRLAYLISIIPASLSTVADVVVPLTTEVPGWWIISDFEMLLLNISFIIKIIVSVVHIYYCYKTFMELGPKGHEEIIYSNSQVGAIATYLGLLIWVATVQGFETLLGIEQPILIGMLIISAILLPFYIRKNKISFIIGIIVVVLLFVGVSVTHSIREEAAIFPSLIGEESIVTLGTTQLYWIFSLFYTLSILCIFFSFISYNELK